VRDTGQDKSPRGSGDRPLSLARAEITKALACGPEPEPQIARCPAATSSTRSRTRFRWPGRPWSPRTGHSYRRSRTRCGPPGLPAHPRWLGRRRDRAAPSSGTTPPWKSENGPTTKSSSMAEGCCSSRQSSSTPGSGSTSTHVATSAGLPRPGQRRALGDPVAPTRITASAAGSLKGSSAGYSWHPHLDQPTGGNDRHVSGRRWRPPPHHARRRTAPPCTLGTNGALRTNPGTRGPPEHNRL